MNMGNPGQCILYLVLRHRCAVFEMKTKMILSFLSLLILAVVLVVISAAVPSEYSEYDETVTVAYCDSLEDSQE